MQADAKDIFEVMASCEVFVPNNTDNNNGCMAVAITCFSPSEKTDKLKGRNLYQFTCDSLSDHLLNVSVNSLNVFSRNMYWHDGIC